MLLMLYTHHSTNILVLEKATKTAAVLRPRPSPLASSSSAASSRKSNLSFDRPNCSCLNSSPARLIALPQCFPPLNYFLLKKIQTVEVVICQAVDSGSRTEAPMGKERFVNKFVMLPLTKLVQCSKSIGHKAILDQPHQAEGKASTL